MDKKVVMTVGLGTEPGKESELVRWYRDVHIPESRPHLQGIAGVELYENLKPGNDSVSVLAIWEFDSLEAAEVVQKAIQSNQVGNYTLGPKCEIKLLSFFNQIQ